MYHKTRQIPQIIGSANFSFDLLLPLHEIPILIRYDHIVVSIHIYTTITAMSLQSLFAM